MKIAIAKDLIEKTGCSRFGDLGDIMSGRFECADIINAYSVYPFNNQHMAVGAFQIDKGNTDALIAGHIFCQPIAGCRFHTQIQLDIRDMFKLLNRGNQL